ncbi:antibiotic biosynthesis monooxygenase [Kitasatospora sp. NBC_00374]|uniref:antibiotic biosynthesis monooxygenase family protein n=1 Tax=Kitasatospora sp. NBC_00374 TaxID=2975964 RepID=UPI0030E1782F
MYVLVYDYEVAEEQRSRFEEVYGASGAWVRLFGRGRGYLGTDLFERVGGGRYLVLDRWADEAAYRAFQEAHGEEYRGLAERTRDHYRTETRLGVVPDGPGLGHGVPRP